jgi:hypothetical protein
LEQAGGLGAGERCGDGHERRPYKRSRARMTASRDGLAGAGRRRRGVSG